MKIAYRLFLFLLISMFLFSCSEKKSGIEGKLLNGRGQPLVGVTVIFKQVQPTKGYEQFETKTIANGVFRIDGVMPSSEYIIAPLSDSWKTKVTTKVTTLGEGQMLALSTPIVIRYNALKDGSVLDTKTGLQWLIMGISDLNSSNVLNTVKTIKEGGYPDWRLPTKAELMELQDTNAAPAAQSEAGLTQKTCCAWVNEPNSENIEWKFYVDDGNDVWASNKTQPDDRVVVVRSYTPTAVPAQAPAAPATPGAPAAPASGPATPSAQPPAPPASVTTTPAAKSPVVSTPPPASVKASPAAKQPVASAPIASVTAAPSAKASSKKPIIETPAPVIEKQDVPVAAPAAVTTAVKSESSGSLRVSRKVCLANKAQGIKSPSMAAAPRVIAPPAAAPRVTAQPEEASTVEVPVIADAPAKHSPPAKVKTYKSEKSTIRNAITIQFDMNKATINPEELAKLKAFYAKIKNKKGRLVIEGNSDSDGDSSDNFRISGERALNAKSMLNKLGLSKSIDVKIAGLSDTKPIADNTTEEGHMLNRRADITFMPESAATAPAPTKQSPSAKVNIQPPVKIEDPEPAITETATDKQLPSAKLINPSAKSEGGASRVSRKACIAKKASAAKQKI